MRVWPDSGFSLMRLYVEEKKFGHPHASMLRRFQHHIMSNARGETLSIGIVSDWLRSVVRAESLKLAICRAQLVTRFLDWLVEQGALGINPFRELRQKYCCRESTAAVVRALVSEDPVEALSALRGLPAYGSHLDPRFGTTWNECASSDAVIKRTGFSASTASYNGVKALPTVPFTAWFRNTLNRPEPQQVTLNG